MSKALLLLVLLTACGSTDIYQNCSGWIFSETALLSAPDSEADTLAVLSPGTSVELFGRPSRNSRTLDWCEVSAYSDPGVVGFVRIIDLALTRENTSYLTQADLEPFNCRPGFRIYGYQILDYPEPLLPPGAEELEIIPVSFSSEPTDFTSLIIAFSYPEGWFPVDTLSLPGTINFAKLYGRWIEETETLILYPYGAMSSSYPISTWSRDKEWKFSLISEEFRDAAAVAYPAMDSLLAEGNIQEAYLESQFAQYINIGNLQEGLHYLSNFAGAYGDSLNAAELENASIR